MWINATPEALEAYISSLARAEDSLPTCSLGTAPSAPSSLTPTASKCSCNGNGTECSPGSLCGEIATPLTDTPGVALSMSSAVASPVRTSPWPEREQAFMDHAHVYGQSSPVSLGKYDRATHSLKTPQLLLFEGSMSSLQTLPRWGWMRAGAVWGLMMSAPRTTANGFGYSLPTPSAVSYGSNQGGAAGRVGPVRPSLETMARQQMWPTPDASDWKQDGLQASQRRLDLYSTVSLNAAVRMWPTPNVPNGGRTIWHAEQEGQSFYHNGKKVQLGLEQAVRLWATPSARDWRSGLASEATMAKNARPLSEQVGGSLNPTWVCWLMGWPLDWEAPGPLNQQTFLVWLQISRSALPG